VDITGHGEGDVAFCAVNADVHSEVLGTFPINFHLIELGEGVDKVIHACLVRPDDCEVVNDESEPDRPVAISKDGRRAGDLRVPVLLQVPEQALLAKSPGLWQAVMCLMHRTIKCIVGEEGVQVVKVDDFIRDKVSGIRIYSGCGRSVPK
jgi:hypothetical protein